MHTYTMMNYVPGEHRKLFPVNNLIYLKGIETKNQIFDPMSHALFPTCYIIDFKKATDVLEGTEWIEKGRLVDVDAVAGGKLNIAYTSSLLLDLFKEHIASK